MPGGVSSPVRSFRSVGGAPYLVDRGLGAYVWDTDGRKLLDYVQSYGASILGHADPDVVATIKRAAEKGTTFGASTEGEVLLAEAIIERVAGCDLVRFVSSGTEACMTAVRLARGVTGRRRIVKFAGCYHGHSDALLAAGGSGVATLGVPDSAGVTEATVADTYVVAYNVVPELDDSVAAVFVEPVAANMGLVAPVDGFLQGLRDECDRVGALLIFDEVITGFRVGFSGASALYAITPDLWCFGKVIGGGLPLAALCGRRDVMEYLAPIGPVYQAGTLSGSPLATAAGLCVLQQLDDAAYRMLCGRAEELERMWPPVFAEFGVDVQVVRVQSLVGLFFSDTPVHNFDDAKRSVAGGKFAPFFHAMLDRGIALPPGPYEVLFASLSHTWGDIERTVDVTAAALGAASL